MKLKISVIIISAFLLVGIFSVKGTPSIVTNKLYPVFSCNSFPYKTAFVLTLTNNCQIMTNFSSIWMNGISILSNGIFNNEITTNDSSFDLIATNLLRIIINFKKEFTPNDFIDMRIVSGDSANHFSTNNISFFSGESNICLSIDGDESDWGGTTIVFHDSLRDTTNFQGADIERLHIYDSSTIDYQTNLFFGFKFNQEQTNNIEYITSIYIDADNNNSTGKIGSPGFVSPSLGSEYLIEIYTYNNSIVNTVIYTNDSINWSPTSHHPEAVIQNSFLEVAIPFVYLSSITGETLGVAVSSSQTNGSKDYFPNFGSSAIKYTLQKKHCWDTEKPFIANSSPPNGFVGVDSDENIQIWFNDNVSVVSDSIVIRIKDSGKLNTAFSNGNFVTNYCFGSNTTWNKGWHFYINPNVNFSKSSLIQVFCNFRDIDNNFCNSNFSFITEYTTYNPVIPAEESLSPVVQGGVFYGFTTYAWGGKEELNNPNHDSAIGKMVLDDYKFIVLGNNLQSKTHADYHSASNIRYQLAQEGRKTKIFGYIPMAGGTSSQLTNQAWAWITNYNPSVDGIFWDEFGYDYGVLRTTQNAVLDFAHRHHLISICNSWQPDYVFSTNSPVYGHDNNPGHLPTTFQAGDYYMDESFLVSSGNYLSVGPAIEKSLKCLKYSKEFGAKIYSASSETGGAGQSTFDSVDSIKKQIYVYFAFLLFGYDYFQYTDANYSATSGDNYIYYLPDKTNATGFPSDWPPFVGTKYLSDVYTNSTSPLILGRCTDLGRIFVNFTTYTGWFEPRGVYYVAADSGNNSYSSVQAQNKNTPWKTISHAISNVSPGSIIKVKGSSQFFYHEEVRVSTSGSPYCSGFITIQGYGDDRPILDGENTLGNGFIFLNGSSYIKLENITIENFTNAGVVVQDCSSSNIFVQNIKLYNNGHYGLLIQGTKNTIVGSIIVSNENGILFNSDCADSNIIQGNVIYNNYNGILDMGGDRNIFANNQIFYNGNAGIFLDNISDNNKISLNRLYKNGNYGVYVKSGTGNIIQNNTSVKQSYGYYFGNLVSAQNNISYSNTIAGYYSELAQNVLYSSSYHDNIAANANINGGNFASGTGCVLLDPLFSNETIDDYRLSFSSPLINIGNPNVFPSTIGGVVTSVRIKNPLPGEYTVYTNTFTLPVGINIPKDAQICFAFPSDFNIANARLLLYTFDGKAYLSANKNELTVVRDGTGTSIQGGTSLKIIFTNIRNTTLPGKQTVKFYIYDSNGNILFWPQQSNDIYIVEPFSIVGRNPVASATNVNCLSTVDIFFSQNINTNTISSNTFYITDDVGNYIPGTISFISPNALSFHPSVSLPANAINWVYVSTNIQDQYGQSLVTNYIWMFSTTAGILTPHLYNSITVDGNLNDWRCNNYISYNRDLTEITAHDHFDSCVMDTTNLYVTWDSNFLYIAIKKNTTNELNNSFRDLFAIDITRDAQGSWFFNDDGEVTAHRSFARPTFQFPRKPEFIINVTYNWSSTSSDNAAICWKWDENTFTWKKDLFSVEWKYNKGESLELKMALSDLTNASVGITSGIPNRIAIQNFTVYNPGCNNINTTNKPQDYCPDDGSWIIADIDNNGDDIPDYISKLKLLYSNPGQNGVININDNIRLGFNEKIDSTTVGTDSIYIEKNGIKILGSFVVVNTNIIFDPADPLIGGEDYKIIITTLLKSLSGSSLSNECLWNFSTWPAPETPHIYNVISCDHLKNDWNNANYVTWDSNYTEHIAHDIDSGTTQITNFWVSWDSTNIYFRLDSNVSSNYGSQLWQDFIAIDVSRDNFGADSFSCTNAGGGASVHTFTFDGTEKPEFIISLRHDQAQHYYSSMEVRKWENGKWEKFGTSGVEWGYQGPLNNSSDICEVWFTAEFLTNSSSGITNLPNRIKVQSFMYNNSTGGQDYCPEDQSWIEVDIDNNKDNMLDDMSLNIISRNPEINQNHVPISNNITVTFDVALLPSTIDTNSFYLMQGEEKVHGNINVVDNIITFVPFSYFQNGAIYTIYMLPTIKGLKGEKLLNTNSWNFYAGDNPETPHIYNVISCDHLKNDWNNANYVTWDSNYTEHIAHDIDSGTTQITNFWVSWDSTNIYFRLDSNVSSNYGSQLWQDFIAIDVSRDNFGADSFSCTNAGGGTSVHTFTFYGTEKPEFIISLRHDQWQHYYSSMEVRKWENGKWEKFGTSGVEWGYQGPFNNSSDICEVWFTAEFLTNSSSFITNLPNRIKVQSFMYNNSTGGQDYCPEDQSWIEVDIDNNEDYILDSIGSKPVLSIIQKITNIILNNNPVNKIIPGCTIRVAVIYSNQSSVSAHNAIIYSKIDTSAVTYLTNDLGNTSGWVIEFSTNTTPLQTWNSTSYSIMLPDKAHIKWMRWKKDSVAPDEDGFVLFYSVIVK